ncbi:hypothetical protein Hypma_014239 [Hypsizygus marmoreus]|uniref:Uncharacterized protein n=1 Tax=Hypsizygus marmoreus TaxID=39966 RepID=A0A369JAL6_HYPMA|nr:hypothetical protein Hypma_014239 [Hypsizygus marmoreus]
MAVPIDHPSPSSRSVDPSAAFLAQNTRTVGPRSLLGARISRGRSRELLRRALSQLSTFPRAQSARLSFVKEPNDIDLHRRSTFYYLSCARPRYPGTYAFQAPTISPDDIPKCAGFLLPEWLVLLIDGDVEYTTHRTFWGGQTKLIPARPSLRRLVIESIITLRFGTLGSSDHGESKKTEGCGGKASFEMSYRDPQVSLNASYRLDVAPEQLTHTRLKYSPCPVDERSAPSVFQHTRRRVFPSRAVLMTCLYPCSRRS